MTRFSSRNISVADVPASRTDLWQVVSNPTTLAELTPLVDRIDADGDCWTWHLAGISALGVEVAPVFTVLMHFDEPARIDFARPSEDGLADERAAVEGVYTLEERPDGRTRLGVDLTMHVELPLPRASRRAVERIMAASMQKTGDRFAERLYAHLDIDPAGATIVRAERADPRAERTPTG